MPTQSSAERRLEKEKQLQARLDYIRKRFKPVDFLRYDCHPMLHAVPKLAYFGVALTNDELLKYATDINLYPNFTDKTEETCHIWAFEQSVKFLSKKIGFPFELRMPLNPDFQWNIALYSNFVVQDRRLIDEDEEAVVKLILKNMGLPEGRMALWHYDFEDGNLDMRCRPWKPPSEGAVKKMQEVYKELELEHKS
ncbi:hypothetical protein BDY19DRAFT_996283 [Irpex rosettiformis]|uniref:Uncharacterized protein n=1 Tax=Irpex rosettiformis TaxID=378272 RepID=A0ACB8TVV5_9APHY|nr:hypothetical protein BDY19DRAFT_996283 [Irpex rosettiformis]